MEGAVMEAEEAAPAPIAFPSEERAGSDAEDERSMLEVERERHRRR